MKIAARITAGLTATLIFAMSPRVAGAQPSAATAQNPRAETAPMEGRYEGTWLTTKQKKLNGTASCQVRQLDRGRWEGRFWGIWQQVPFDYKVEFTAANAEKTTPLAAEKAVRGTATIDGAHYDWVGTLTPADFNIQFTGTRYHGHLELKRVTDNKTSAE